MAGVRARGAAGLPPGGGFDVFLHGDVFFDLVFTGLDAPPRPGTEILTSGMGSLPGGIANLAVASARLGLSTALAAGFGDDVYGTWLREVLASEGVDLAGSITVPQHTNVTVSLSLDGDRAMVTHGHDLPVDADTLIGTPPPTRAVITDLGGHRGEQQWWRRAAGSGALVFADIGWDPSGAWDAALLEPLRLCHAFVPNNVEAMAYTRTTTPEAALARLADLVPLAVVTLGPDGAIALDRETGEEAHAAGVPVEAIDPTGAGDVFMSALVHARLQRWPLAEAADFAVLCSALSVTQFGGSLAAPGWGDIRLWFDAVRGARPCTRFPRSDGLAERFAFLDGVIPSGPLADVRRAEGTFAAHADFSERYPRRPWRDVAEAWRARRRSGASGVSARGGRRRRR